MLNPEKLWFDIVHRFSAQSKCKSRKVGAVIVKNGNLIAEGWNSPPGLCTEHDCKRERCLSKDNASTSGMNLDTAICVHAEANSIGNCAKRGVSTDGATIYVTHLPCLECSKLIISAGIKEVVYDQFYPSEASQFVLKKSDVILRQFKL